MFFLTARRLAALEGAAEYERQERARLERRIVALESRMELRAQESDQHTRDIAGLRNAVERLAAKLSKKKMPPVVALACLLLAAPTLAAPPPGTDPDSATAQWFQSLKQPGNGISCCSLADCRPVEYRIGATGYQVLIDAVWVDVPPEKVLRRENPTGEAIACRSGSVLFCFVAPDLS